jgi:hypothetical protein
VAAPAFGELTAFASGERGVGATEGGIDFVEDGGVTVNELDFDTVFARMVREGQIVFRKNNVSSLVLIMVVETFVGDSEKMGERHCLC